MLLRKLELPLALVNVARFMHRGLLDDCVASCRAAACSACTTSSRAPCRSRAEGRSRRTTLTCAPRSRRALCALRKLAARVLLCDEETLEGRAGAQPQHHHLDQAAVGAGHGPRAATRGVAARPMCSFAARKPPLLSIAICSGGGEVRVRARLHV